MDRPVVGELSGSVVVGVAARCERREAQEQ